MESSLQEPESAATDRTAKTKKTLVGGLLILVGILFFGYMQLGWFGATTETDTEWLMVLHAGEAEITERSGKAFLTLSEISRNTVMFSDRPERKYQSVDTNQFLEQWDDLFASSPPNAAVVHAEVGADTELVIVELFKPVIRSDEISFPIKIIGGNYRKDKRYKDVNLFIDGIEDSFRNYTVDVSEEDTDEYTFDGAPVTVSGGHEITVADRSRPVDLIGAIVGITGEQVRNAFDYPVPENAGNLNDEEAAAANRAALLAQLEEYGVTGDEFDIATNYYQYFIVGGVWSYAHAQLKAIIEDNELVGFEIVYGGRGYTSEPSITVEGYGRIEVDITISYTDDFETNGAITAITLR